MEPTADALRVLSQIYQEYETDAAPFKTVAVCGEGCDFCCTHYGVLDVTSLEGWVIYTWIQKRPKRIRRELIKAVARNRKRKLQGDAAVCPFLNRKHNCRIYPIRPFSCRQLYSLERCGKQGPLVSRQAMDLARQTVDRLQALDGHGYSGHLTYILDLLDRDEIRTRYLQGQLNPGAIHDLGRRYGLRIHQHPVEGH